MASAVQELVDILNLEPLEVNLFRGRSPQSRWQRVFGGQVIGQALVAACRTVDDVTTRPPHSLHAYFLLGGDPKVPIIYDVDRIRDGKSFTTRNVKAIQHGHAIFSMSVSFHVHEEGLVASVRHARCAEARRVAGRDRDLKKNVWPKMPEPVRRYYERERPIELRPVEHNRYLGDTLKDGRFHVWMRATGRLPDEPAIHQCVLAYASDMMLLDAALIPHRPLGVQRGHHGGEPRSCAVVPPPVPRRRVAPLCAGQSEPRGLSGLLARPDLRRRRHSGCLGGPGGTAAAAPRNRRRLVAQKLEQWRD